ncbi:MAG: hypothetical protein J0I06_11800 [Planctomycetes bacterium]|nr:hypothetical protein [Planctomycetota bacterium]
MSPQLLYNLAVLAMVAVMVIWFPDRLGVVPLLVRPPRPADPPAEPPTGPPVTPAPESAPPEGVPWPRPRPAPRPAFAAFRNG